MDMNFAAAAAGLEGGEGAAAAAGAAAGEVAGAGAGAAAPAGAVADSGAGAAGADLGGVADAVAAAAARAAAEREAAYKEIDAMYEASQYVQPCEYNTDDDVDEDNFKSYVQRQVKGFESRILKTVRRGRHACPFSPCKVKDGALASLEMHAMDTSDSAREWQGKADHEALARIDPEPPPRLLLRHPEQLPSRLSSSTYASPACCSAAVAPPVRFRAAAVAPLTLNLPCAGVGGAARGGAGTEVEEHGFGASSRRPLLLLQYPPAPLLSSPNPAYARPIRVTKAAGRVSRQRQGPRAYRRTWEPAAAGPARLATAGGGQRAQAAARPPPAELKISGRWTRREGA
nr:uncharacterized protein LOC127303213 [Lolium perenne]